MKTKMKGLFQSHDQCCLMQTDSALANRKPRSKLQEITTECTKEDIKYCKTRLPFRLFPDTETTNKNIQSCVSCTELKTWLKGILH